MLNEVLSDIASLVRAQDGQLVAIRVVCPEGAHDEVRQRLLLSLGLPDLEVRFEDIGGPLRVLAAEFAPAGAAK